MSLISDILHFLVLWYYPSPQLLILDLDFRTSVISVPRLPRLADELDDNFWPWYLPFGSHEYVCGASSL